MFVTGQAGTPERYTNKKSHVISMYNNSRLRRYYRVYERNQNRRGLPVVSLKNFANRGLPRLVNHFKKDYAAYLTARNTVAIRNMDPVEHAMIMQYNNDGYNSYGNRGYRKRLIEKVGEGLENLRKNNRFHREKKLAETRKSNVPNEYGSVIKNLTLGNLRTLRTALTGESSRKTTANQAKRDIIKALNKMTGNK